MVIIRETGVLARSNDPNSVAVSNWAESTDYVGKGGVKGRGVYGVYGLREVVSTNAIYVSQKGLIKQKGGRGEEGDTRLGVRERVTIERASESVCVICERNRWNCGRKGVLCFWKK